MESNRTSSGTTRSTGRRMPRAGFAMAFAVLLGLALWQLGSGIYIYAKASVGQALIARAWTDTLARRQPVKPWAWADTAPIGRLVVNELGIDQVVLAGASGRTLAFGPGHHDGTVYPGQPGVAIIAGHRDTHFRFLRDLAPGQAIDFQTRQGRWLTFVVEETLIIDTENAHLTLDAETPMLVLTTCYPFEAIAPGGPLRYVVVARLEGVRRIREMSRSGIPQ